MEANENRATGTAMGMHDTNVPCLFLRSAATVEQPDGSRVTTLGFFWGERESLAELRWRAEDLESGPLDFFLSKKRPLETGEEDLPLPALKLRPPEGIGYDEPGINRAFECEMIRAVFEQV